MPRQKRKPLVDIDGADIVDINGNPIYEDVDIDIDTVTPISDRSAGPSDLERQITGEPSTLRRAWDAAYTPLTTLPSRIAKPIADYTDQPRLPTDSFADDTFMGDLEDRANKLSAQVRGFGAGAIQALGDFASQATSIGDLVPMLLSGGSSFAARKGLGQIAKLANVGSRVTSAPVMAHGAQTLYNAEGPGDIATGLMEIGGGALGVAEPMPRVRNKVPPPVMHGPDLDMRPMRERIAEIENLPEELPVQVPPVKPKLKTVNQSGIITDINGVPVNERELMPEVPQELTRDSDFFVKNQPDISEATISRFPLGGKRQVYDIAEQLSRTTDEGLTDELIRSAENIIYRESDPTIIQDNVRQLEDYLSGAIKDQNPDTMEIMRGLYDSALDKSRGGQLPDDLLEGMDISEAKIGENRARMDIGDRKSMIQMFRKTYKGSVPQTAVKELVQNAIDATAQKADGQIDVSYDSDKGIVNVSDNGSGLTLEQLQNEFTDLSSSGKRGGPVKTIGEMGVGKTTYLVAGEKVKVTTISREADGRLMQYEFEATPEEIIDGFDIKETPMPEGTPTGTHIEVRTKPHEGYYNLREYIDGLSKYSGSPVPFRVTNRTHKTTTNVRQKTDVPKKLIAQGESQGAGFQIHIPEDAVHADTDKIALILNNRGMFQGVDTITLNSRQALPDRLVIDIDPKVDAAHDLYPLTAPTREALTYETRNKVIQMIQDTVIKGAIQKQREQLGNIFKSLIPKEGQSHTVADRRGVYTPEELGAFQNSQALKKISAASNQLLAKVSGLFKDRQLGDIMSFGYILDEETRGINVRNPNNTKEYSIMLNPATILASASSPDEAANAMVHVLLHEYTHMLVREEGSDFTSALADVLTKIGPRDQMFTQGAILNALSDKLSPGTYNPEVSQLLQTADSARGRKASTDDTLFTQGGSKVTTGTGPDETGISPQQSGTGAKPRFVYVRPGPNAISSIKRAVEAGYKHVGMDERGRVQMEYTGQPRKVGVLETEVRNQRGGRSRPSKKQVLTATEEAINFPRAVMASSDVSAPLRQGLPLIGRTEFWNSIVPMFKAWASEQTYKDMMWDIRNGEDYKALFGKRKAIDPKTGKPIILDSYAEQAGLRLSDLDEGLTSREESLQSTWAERIPFLGKSEKLAEMGVPQANLVRRGNRAYTAFLNKLRADTFKSMVTEANIFMPGAKANQPLAKEMANFVNVATGRGSLGKLEAAAPVLNAGLFAPRLIASRLQMLNPHFYWAASPPVRKEALRAVIAMGAFANIIGQLSTMAGAKVENNPNSPDFGKIQVRNTRIDPFAGFQQYIVAANRLLRPSWARIPGLEKVNTGILPLDLTAGFLGHGGQMVETSKGAQYDLWNPKPPANKTHLSVLWDFARGKLNPLIGFGVSLYGGRREISGHKMDLTTLNPMENAALQRMIPILFQDIYELAQEDPKLLPLALLEALGMGVQPYSDENPWRTR